MVASPLRVRPHSLIPIYMASMSLSDPYPSLSALQTNPASWNLHLPLMTLPVMSLTPNTDSDCTHNSRSPKRSDPSKHPCCPSFLSQRPTGLASFRISPTHITPFPLTYVPSIPLSTPPPSHAHRAHFTPSLSSSPPFHPAQKVHAATSRKHSV